MPLVTRSAGGSGGTLHVGPVQPTMNQGDLWFDTTNLILYYAENATPTLRQIEQTGNKNTASGYAGLDTNTKIPLNLVSPWVFM